MSYQRKKPTADSEKPAVNQTKPTGETKSPPVVVQQESKPEQIIPPVQPEPVTVDPVTVDPITEAVTLIKRAITLINENAGPGTIFARNDLLRAIAQLQGH